MAITDPLVLPSDVILVPVDQLPTEVREQIAYKAGDYAVTRPLARTPSKIVDEEAIKLLREFRTPKTLVAAVISYSRASQGDPEQILDRAYPLIRHLVNTRVLVPAGSTDAEPIRPSLQPGDRVGNFQVTKCIQVLEDTELYEATRGTDQTAALKILRTTSPLANTVETEVKILRHLDGRVNPKLLEVGHLNDHPYMAVEWVPGTEAGLAAEALRRLEGEEARRGLLDLSCAVLEAYAHLHAQGVIHSDIHPRNILVLTDGSAKIIDYGLSRFEQSPSTPGHAQRGGVIYFREPESLMPRAEALGMTALGEQYSLGALIYYLMTGALYLDFSLEKDLMLRQILDEVPLPFSRRGIQSWPEVETLLAKALSKNPLDRFASVAEFAAQFRTVPLSESPSSLSSSRTDKIAEGPEVLLEEVLERLGIESSFLTAIRREGPAVNTGTAGVAYGLYRIAQSRADSKLLSLADVWLTKALQASADPAAFYTPATGGTAEVIGRVSLYHTASGVYCVQALLSHALGDLVSQQMAVERFMQASQASSDNLDLTLGRSGTLLGSALLLEALPRTATVRSNLLQFGGRVMSEIWDHVNSYATIQECAELDFLGLAHGWAGILYATLRWVHASGDDVPPGVKGRLGELADCAEPVGQGLRWKRVLGRQEGVPAWADYVPSWCSGSAGFVFLWTIAHMVLRQEVYLRLAERTGRHTWEDTDRYGDLCCGCAGRAYALLELYKCTGEMQWLQGAQELANYAATSIRRRRLVRDSLYKGEVGVAVLAADLSRPETACMPFFGQEGWSMMPDRPLLTDSR